MESHQKQIERPAQEVKRELKKVERVLAKLKRVEIQEFSNYLSSPWRIFWANFLAGTSRGLGFILGVALVLTIVGFVMTKVLTQIPVVGEFFQAVNHWIQETVQQAKP